MYVYMHACMYVCMYIHTSELFGIVAVSAKVCVSGNFTRSNFILVRNSRKAEFERLFYRTDIRVSVIELLVYNSSNVII